MECQHLGWHGVKRTVIFKIQMISGFLFSFPAISSENFIPSSPVDPRYNCIAWAANVSDKWWWPDKYGYWPKGVPRKLTVPSFINAFETLGYSVCKDGSLEEGVEKVVIYVKDLVPTHMSRQANDGRWLSKLGPDIDVIHSAPEVLEGPIYGTVHTFLSRSLKLI